VGSPKGCKQHDRVWVSFGNTSVGTGRTVSFLLCMNGLRNQSSHPISGSEAFSQSRRAVAGQESWLLQDC